jgi:hypothetical protein
MIGPVNTGLAIANPNDRPATMSFSFTDGAGRHSATGTAIIPANGQMAKFLNQAPFNGGDNISGTLSFSSDIPISVVALRGFVNERNEFLMSTLPVLDMDSPASTGSTVLPHFVIGGGWTTQVILVNRADKPVAGDIRFVSQEGAGIESFPFWIPGRSSFKLAWEGAAAQSGSIRIEMATGGPTPNSVAIYSYKRLGVTVSEAAIASTSGQALRMYVEVSCCPGNIGGKNSGVAVANLSSTGTTVNFELFRMDGSLLATRSVILPANGQTARTDYSCNRRGGAREFFRADIPGSRQRRRILDAVSPV